MLRPVFMGYTTMGYSMGSILRAILGRPYDSTVLMTPAATLQVCGLFKSAYFDAKARSSTKARASSSAAARRQPSRQPRRAEPRDLRALRDTPSSSSSSSEPRELRALRGSSPARAPRTPASTGGPGPGARP